ncbi:MAG TPA: hypothetical protein VMF12_06330 [Xanthobacteraceae bacterium]|nr:hypothetical protein [Xanthobacteraceae bacterium]
MHNLKSWKSVFQTSLLHGHPEAIEKLSSEQPKGRYDRSGRATQEIENTGAL